MRHGVLLIAVAALTAAGCANGPDNGPVVPHPVSGKVMYDGKPAAGVQVTLIPGDAPMVPRIPRNPHGITGSDGRFTITTFTEGDGAAEGGYQVVLVWPKPEDETSDLEEHVDADRLLGGYDATHSTLNVRVKSGDNELPTFNLRKVTQPPAASEGVPGRN